ncbi:hypothetical protein BGX27_007381, partial [Mortierella sp. AM989]
ANKTEGSWVWRWAEKRAVAGNDNQVKIFCLYKNCNQKKGYAIVGISTAIIMNHLKKVHKLSVSSGKDQSNHSKAGSIEDALANQGRRPSAHLTAELFSEQICKVVVRHKLPSTFPGSILFKELLLLAQSAPSAEDIKLPSNDTVARN